MAEKRAQAYRNMDEEVATFCIWELSIEFLVEDE